MLSLRKLLALVVVTLSLPSAALAQCGESRELIPVPDPGGDRYGTAVAATDTRLIVGGYSQLYVFSSATGIQLASYVPFVDGGVMQLAASHQFLVVGLPDYYDPATSFNNTGKALVYDLSTFALLGELPPHDPAQNFDALGRAVAVFGSMAVVSQQQSGGVLDIYSLTPTIQRLTTLQGSSSFGSEIALNASYLAVGESGQVRIYSVPAFSSIGSITETSDAFAILDDLLFVGRGALNEVRVYDLSTLQLVHTITPSFLPNQSVYFGQSLSIHGPDIASGSLAVGSRSAAFLFDTATFTETARYVAGSAQGPSSPTDHGRWVALNSNWLLAGASGEAVLFDLNAPCELTTFCYGDGSSGSPCLCGNTSAAGAREGCRNSTGVGARLRAVGSTAIVDDDMQFVVDQGPAGQPGVFVQGETTQALPFFDGILCMGNPTRRMSFAFFDGQGQLVSQGSIPSQGGGLLPGSTRHYQLWYRDPGGSPCGTSANLTNGVRVDWR